jgi:transposase-like protein
MAARLNEQVEALRNRPTTPTTRPCAPTREHDRAVNVRVAVAVGVNADDGRGLSVDAV